MRPVRVLTMAATAGLLLASCASMTGKEPMSFFVTSTGSGKGADLGGLAGADAHCQKLAAGGRCRRQDLARLPQHARRLPVAGQRPGRGSVNARDRIGTGPWFNAKGELIARDVAPPAQRQQPQQGHGARREGQRQSTAAATRPTSTTS